jgi:hypothetical protein
VRQNTRFDELGEYSKAILETLSIGNASIQEAIQRESTKTDERNQETIATVTAKQESIRVAVAESISSHAEAIISTSKANNDELLDSIRKESERSDEREHETTTAVVSRQEELHAEVQHGLEQLDASSREEHEATRRELEQMKKAMEQIIEDIARRDEELRLLLRELNQSKSSSERKKLKERSNAVTVALCALVTIYESLQV